MIDFEKLIEIGFVPSAIIVGGWSYAVILLLVLIYYFVRYLGCLMTGNDK